MSEEPKKREDDGMDMDSLRFVSLISSFAASAYQSMGKLADPVSGETTRDLSAAQGFIDILAMLRVKTVGNLSDRENQLLESTISDLQINFVQEQSRPAPDPAESAAAAESGKKAEEGDVSGEGKEPEGGASEAAEEEKRS